MVLEHTSLALMCGRVNGGPKRRHSASVLGCCSDWSWTCQKGCVQRPSGVKMTAEQTGFNANAHMYTYAKSSLIVCENITWHVWTHNAFSMPRYQITSSWPWLFEGSFWISEPTYRSTQYIEYVYACLCNNEV